MKLLFRFLLVSATFALAMQFSTLLAQDDSAAPAPAPAQDAEQPTGAVSPDNGGGSQDDSASFQTFYDSLANQGTWIQSSDYGYVWQPQVTDPNWAPYTAGHWVYSDAGWTWVSDEPWGWATYHYGRWANIEGTGWVWVPGYTWAPAWVSWRYGDGYAGWAPLPPDSFVGVDYSSDDSSSDAGYHIGDDVDDTYGIGAGWYIFLPVNCLCYHSYHGYYCHRYDNFSIINNTENVTNLNVNRHRTYGGFSHVMAGGPRVAQVNDASQTPMPTVTLARATQPGGGAVTGNSAAFYAPHIGTGTTGRPARVGATIGQAKINRGTEITRPLMVNAGLAATPATQAEIEKARAAQGQAPAGAKVLAGNAAFKPVLQTPVTLLKPIVAPTRTLSANPNAVTHPQGMTQAPIFAPPARTYPQTESGAYPAGPSASTQPHPAGNPAYNPYVQRQVAPATMAPAENSGGGTTQPRVMERPSAPVTTAPVVHESAPSGGGNGGRVESTGGGSRSAPSSAASGPSSAPPSGGSGTGNSGGSAGSAGSRSH
jgi:hypothetical protein